MLNDKILSGQKSDVIVTDWWHSFNKIYAQFIAEIDNEANYYTRAFRLKYVLQSIAKRYYKRLLANEPNNSYLRPVYRILAGLATIEKMNAYMRLALPSEDDDCAYSEFSQLIDEITDDVVTLDRTRLPDAYVHFIGECMPHFDTLLRVRREYQYLSMLLYRIAWATLFNRKEWIVEQEKMIMSQLRGVATDLTMASHLGEGVTLPIALIHFAFIRGDDELAMTRAKQLHSGHVNVFFYMIEYAHKQNNVERMLAWLHVAKDELKPYLFESGQYQLKRDYCDFLLHYYSIYAEMTDTPEAYVNALKQLLPYSFNEYNDHLFHNEDYRTWAELQLLVGFQPEIHARAHLREIELADRALLLPLYHQAVEKAIAERNRNAYKLAVKRLKKLRTHYRQLKKADMWENYLQVILEKYRRLRAFQDEVRKGKLIHD